MNQDVKTLDKLTLELRAARQRIAELEAFQVEILQSENKYWILAENAYQAVFVIQDDSIRFVNRKAKELLGVSQEEVPSGSFGQFVYPEDRAVAAERYRKRLSGESLTYPFAIRMLDGKGGFWWAHLYSVPVEWKGRTALLVSAVDVSELKEAEQALQESRQMLRLILDSIPVQVFWKDRTSVYLGCNQMFARYLGLTSPEEIVNKSDHQLSWYEDQADLLRESDRKVMESNESAWHVYGPRLRPNKEPEWLDSRLAPLRDSAGNVIGVLGTFQDITERKRTEELLEDSEERLELALSGAGLGLWDWNVRTDEVVRDSRWTELLGYSLEEVEPYQASWRKRIHPDDMVHVMENLTDHMNGTTPTYEAEYRLRTKSGDWKWVLARGTVVQRGKNGEPLRMTGTTLDISERKAVQQALLKSEEKYKLLIESLPHAVAIFQDSRLVFVNSSGAKMLGCNSPADLLGMDVLDPVPDREKARLAGYMEARLRGDLNVPVSYETILKRRSGEEFTAEIHAAMINYRGRPADQVVASDISERKAAERELRIIGHAIESSINAMGIADLDGKLTYVNTSFLKLWGCDDKKEVLGKPAIQFWEMGEKAAEIAEALKNRGGWIGELIAKKRDGALFDAQLSASVATDATGLPICVMASCVDIADRKRAEEDLRRSKDLIEALLNGTNDAAALFDREGRWIATNNRSAEALQTVPDKILGRALSEAFPPDLAQSRLAAIGQVVETGKQMRAMEELSSRMLDTTLTPVFSPNGDVESVAVFSRDITDQKKAEAELRESRQLLQGILNASPVGIAMAEDRKTVWVNETMLKMFGYSLESDYIGKSTMTFYASGEDYERVGRLMARELAAGKTFETEVPFCRKDGALIDCRLKVSTLDPTRPLRRTVVTVSDISDDKKAREALLQAERFKAVADLASGVAHNFNNLLQIVASAAQLSLQDLQEGDSSSVRHHLEQILEIFKFGAETVRRIQTFAGIRRESRLEQDTIVDLSEVARQAAELSELWWKTNPEKEGIEISFSLNTTSGCLAKGKKNELFDVVVNLIKNAAEALPEGGHIGVTTLIRDNKVVLEVEDTGIGIPPENLGRLFTPFFTTKMAIGTGLGLATCSRIVEDHGGEIAVYSKPGKGSRFTILLPQAGTYVKEEKLPAPESFDLKLRILLIDDMDLILELVEEGLTRYDQTVFAAHSGHDGLEIFQRQPVDLVICDLGMPGMNGWEVGKQIRRICEEKGIQKPPFILLTGWGDQAHEERKILEAGVDSVVKKPVDMIELLQAIRQVVRPN